MIQFIKEIIALFQLICFFLLIMWNMFSVVSFLEEMKAKIITKIRYGIFLFIISTLSFWVAYIFLGKVSYYIEHNISWLYILITYIFMNIPDIALKIFKKYKKGSETQ